MKCKFLNQYSVFVATHNWLKESGNFFHGILLPCTSNLLGWKFSRKPNFTTLCWYILKDITYIYIYITIRHRCYDNKSYRYHPILLNNASGCLALNQWIMVVWGLQLGSKGMMDDWGEWWWMDWTCLIISATWKSPTDF
jgi:hypothetical protein